jgi:intracellular septation protein A
MGDAGARRGVSLTAATCPPMTPPTHTTSPSAAASPAKDNPLLEIAITVIVPAIILMQLSSETRLGPVYALLLALAFPLTWGVRDGLRRRKLNWLAVLGVVSTLLTGGIGLLKLDPQWLAVKEAAVPALIGLVVLGSNWTRWPLIRVLVFSPALFDVDKVQRALEEKRTTVPFELRLRTGTVMLAGTFFFSAVANYVLARWVVVSPAGTEAFNQELGRLTLLSYPVIAIPSMLMMMGLMLWLARGARQLTGLDLGDMMRGG